MITFILSKVLASLATGPQNIVEPIVTDRPDFTESAAIVPQRRFQVENGATWAIGDESNQFNLSETLIRYGLNSQTELRIGLPNYNWVEGAEGFDDFTLGAKYLFPLAGQVSVALIGGVSFPVGVQEFRAENATPFLILTASGTLGHSSVGTQLGVSFESENGLRREQFQHTLVFGFPINENSGIFLEHVLDFGSHTRPSHLLHFGLTTRPNDDSQWDIHFGVGLNREAPRFFAGLGYSVRF